MVRRSEGVSGGAGPGRCAWERQAQKAGEQGPGEAKGRGPGPGPGGEREPQRRGPPLRPTAGRSRLGLEPRSLGKPGCGGRWGARRAGRGRGCPEALTWSAAADSPGHVLRAPPGGLPGDGSAARGPGAGARVARCGARAFAPHAGLLPPCPGARPAGPLAPAAPRLPGLPFLPCARARLSSGDGDPPPSCLPRPRSCSAHGGLLASPGSELQEHGAEAGDQKHGAGVGWAGEGWGRAAGQQALVRWCVVQERRGSRAQQGAPPRAQRTWSPAAPHPLQPHTCPAGLSREGPTWPEAGKMLLGAQGLPGTVLAAACVLPAAPEGRGVRPLGGAPRACERRGAPGKPRCSKQEVAGGGPRPGREGSPQFHDVLARAPGRKPTRGLGGSPRAWLGPGSQGAAEGRVQRMAGHGSHHTPPPRPPWPPRSPPPTLALAGPGRGTALGPPIHGGPRRP